MKLGRDWKGWEEGTTFPKVIREDIFEKRTCWLDMEPQERAGFVKKCRKRIRQREQPEWRRERVSVAGWW